MTPSDSFSFSGVPECVEVLALGEGFKVKIRCKNIRFTIKNLVGSIDFCNVYYFTAKKEVAYSLKGYMDIEGVICTDANDIKNLIALRISCENNNN